MPENATDGSRPGSSGRAQRPPAWSRGAVAGAVLILAAEALLVVDVVGRGGSIVPAARFAAPVDVLETVARWSAIFLTPLCWTGYLLLLDGAFAWHGRQGGAPSPARARPRRFVATYLLSIPVWLVFDWVNFGFIDAWRYHGLPTDAAARYAGYALAFGAISPGMFLTAEAVRRWRAGRLTGTPIRVPVRAYPAIMLVGAAMTLFPFAVRDPVGSLTLWLGFVFLLDPLNDRLGLPSLFADWRRGRYGRSVALMAGGAICGLLWEFWNYWAIAKWTYNLPFLGSLEGIRYFEMPVLGFAGFLPFALECWVMTQTLLHVLRRCGTGGVEPLPDEGAVQ